MRILALSPGYVGGKLVDALRRRDHEVVSERVEITDISALREALARHRPEAVLNCAGRKGSPNVDWCETNQIPTMLSNAVGAMLVAQACVEAGIHLASLGTGCIFYGASPDPAGWTEDDFANPSAFYTRSKYAADLVLSRLPGVATIRFRMPISAEPHPGNLIDKLARYPKIIDVVNSVTVVDDLETATVGIIEKRAEGIFHAVNGGTMRHRDLIALYRELVDPAHTCEWIADEDLLAQGLVAGKRSNNVLQNRRLPEIGVHLRPIDVALRDAMERYAARRREMAVA